MEFPTSCKRVRTNDNPGDMYEVLRTDHAVPGLDEVLRESRRKRGTASTNCQNIDAQYRPDSLNLPLFWLRFLSQSHLEFTCVSFISASLALLTQSSLAHFSGDVNRLNNPRLNFCRKSIPFNSRRSDHDNISPQLASALFITTTETQFAKQ